MYSILCVLTHTFLLATDKEQRQFKDMDWMLSIITIFTNTQTLIHTPSFHSSTLPSTLSASMDAGAAPPLTLTLLCYSSSLYICPRYSLIITKPFLVYKEPVIKATAVPDFTSDSDSDRSWLSISHREAEGFLTQIWSHFKESWTPSLNKEAKVVLTLKKMWP